MSPPVLLSDETLAEIRGWGERRLTAAEVAERLRAPISHEEREQVLSLVGWFCRRYATPADRLAYVRRAYARWQRTRRR